MRTSDRPLGSHAGRRSRRGQRRPRFDGAAAARGGIGGTPITTLAECAEACAAQCPDTCNYVSFSATNADCSWYSECDLDSPPLTIAHYRSAQVAKLRTDVGIEDGAPFTLEVVKAGSQWTFAVIVDGLQLVMCVAPAVQWYPLYGELFEERVYHYSKESLLKKGFPVEGLSFNHELVVRGLLITY